MRLAGEQMVARWAVVVVVPAAAVAVWVAVARAPAAVVAGVSGDPGLAG
ncbi:hypothetical protein [Mycolicibacterium sphagni]